MTEQATITQTKAAKVYGMSARTLSRWEKSGKIVGKRQGGLKFYPVRDLDRLTGNKQSVN